MFYRSKRTRNKVIGTTLKRENRKCVNETIKGQENIDDHELMNKTVWNKSATLTVVDHEKYYIKRYIYQKEL